MAFSFALGLGNVSAQVPLPLGADLQAVIDSHPAGTDFILEAGVHRGEEIELRLGDTLTGEDGAVMSGAELLTGWRFEAPYWIHDGPHADAVAPYDPSLEAWEVRAFYPHDLFADDHPIIQVTQLGGLDIAERRFLYDYNRDRIYLNFDPAGQTMELSGLCRFAVRSAEGGGVVRNIHFEKHATTGQRGAVETGPNSLVEDCVVTGSHSVGLRVGFGSTVRRCRFLWNGNSGFQAVGESILVEENEAAYNGWAGFSGNWGRGGIKLPTFSNSIFRRNYTHHNTGPGVWSDVNAHQSVFEENLSEYNSWEGLLVELSCDCIVRNNIFRGNGVVPRGGLLWGVPFILQNSKRTEVHNNYCESSLDPFHRAGGITIINQVRDNHHPGSVCGNHTAEENHIHDNVIVMPHGGSNGQQYGISGYDTYEDFANANTWENNSYYSGAPPRRTFHWFDPGFVQAFLSWDEWLDRGRDAGSTFVGRPEEFFHPMNPELNALILATTGVTYEQLKSPFVDRELTEEEDQDGDGMADEWELEYGLDPQLDDSAGDPDEDGLSNGEEFELGSDPRSGDPDGDGLTDPQELAAGTDPLSADTDGDGLPDPWEIGVGLSPVATDGLADPDGDGLNNLEESEIGTDPLKPDPLRVRFPSSSQVFRLRPGPGLVNLLDGTVDQWDDPDGEASPVHPYNLASPELSDSLVAGYPAVSTGLGSLKVAGVDLFGETLPGWTVSFVARSLEPSRVAGPSGVMGNSLYRKSGFRLIIEQGYLRFYSTQDEDPLSLSAYKRLEENELAVITLSYDAVGREARFYINGVEQDRGEGWIPPNNVLLWLGRVGGVPIHHFDFVEVFGFSKALDPLERREVEAMLLGKYLGVGPGMGDPDGDGIASWFELSYGPGLDDPQADPDGDDLSNLEEFENLTDPFLADSDADGWSDSWEVDNGWNPWVNHATDDPDRDGLGTVDELVVGTLLDNPDSDGDGMLDGWEVAVGTNPLADDRGLDPDEDGLTNLEEHGFGTSANNPDTDGDGLSDEWETTEGTDPLADDTAEDPDEDGLSNLEEDRNGTSPLDPDSDDDGLPDGWEISVGSQPLVDDAGSDADSDGLDLAGEFAASTDPTMPDSDGDGIDDGPEVANGLRPLIHDALLDYDFDGQTNLAEIGAGSDPTEWVDVDGDGLHDRWEALNGLDPGSDDADGDRDGDQLNNRLEFVLGSDPQDGRSMATIEIEGDAEGGRPLCRYQISLAAGVYYETAAQFSSDLASWAVSPPEAPDPVVEISGGTLQIEVVVPAMFEYFRVRSELRSSFRQ